MPTSRRRNPRPLGRGGINNYSSSNLLTYERVGQYKLDETFRGEGAAYRFSLYPADGRYRWGDFAAAAILSGVPITAVFLYAQRWLVAGLTAGGVKG